MDGSSTKTPKRRTTYMDVQSEAKKPVRERNWVTSNRGKQVVPRRYEMLLEKAEAKKVESAALGRDFINPHPTGMYKAITETLGTEGVNKWHTYAVLRDGIKAILSEEKTKNKAGETAWDRFEKKDHVNDPPPNHKDIRGRIEQNAMVLQRVTMFKMDDGSLIFDDNGQPIVIAGGQNPYGDRLRQFCQSIDIRLVEKHGEVVLEFMLNTEWDIPEIVRPLKPNRRKLRATENAATKAEIKKIVKKQKKAKSYKKANTKQPVVEEPVVEEPEIAKSDADAVASAFSIEANLRDEPSDDVLADILADEAIDDTFIEDEDNQAIA